MAVVLDSSAILADLFMEPGAELVRGLRGNPLASAVNVAEVHAKLLDRSRLSPSPESAKQEIRELEGGWRFQTIDFDAEQALKSGELRPVTRHLGLSLGDRACLALALVRKLPVLTADRSWLGLDIGVEIRSIR